MGYTRQIVAASIVGVLFCAWSLSPNTGIVAAQQAAAPAVGTGAHPEMPDGPGKDITINTCTKCHAITNVTSQRKDEDGWTETITKMIGYGAVGSDEDLEKILGYLTKNYGKTPAASAATAPAATPAPKIEVNKETAAQLATHLGLSDKDAEAVVSYREKNGSFKTIDDLKKVPSIDTKKIDDKKNDLSFS